MNLFKNSFIFITLSALTVNLNCMENSAPKRQKIEEPKQEQAINITDLPDEIIYNIVEQFFAQNRDLHAIKQFAKAFLPTCKKFAAFAGDIKKKNLEIETDWIENLYSQTRSLDATKGNIAATIGAKVWEKNNPIIRKMKHNNKEYIVTSIGSSDRLANNLTILQSAAISNNIHLFNLLTQANSTIRRAYPYGIDAFRFAFQGNKTQMIFKLLQNNSEESLLSAAAVGANYIIEYLLSLGTDVNYKDRFEKTALMYAVERDKKESCQLLLKHGANVADRDKESRTSYA